MKPDVASRKNIKDIITKFYHLLLVDEKMIPFFKDIIAENQLEQHLEHITDFGMILFLPRIHIKII